MSARSGVQQLRPSEPVAVWFRESGFVASPDGESYERSYTHSSGYGSVTLRFWPHDYGWDAIAETRLENGERIGVNLGTCRSTEDIARVWAAVWRLQRAHGLDLQGVRVAPAEPLVVRAS